MRVHTSSACVEHDPGADHPDQPARLQAVLDTLRIDPAVELVSADPVGVDALLVCHGRQYLERAAALSAAGGGELGTDTTLNRASWRAATGATGALLSAIEHARESGVNGFAAVRPPGHHALADRAMGFCIISHIAVAALNALHSGSQRVLVVDWDVHHGNGTQALVEHEPAIRFVSLHQWPWYPGTGAADERGVGNVFNFPMSPSLPPSAYVETLWRGIEVATSGWRPDLILVSAGYDAMLGDPLGGFTLEPEHYALWVERLRVEFRDVPIVAMMEGGYDPARLAAGVAATVAALGS